jgi:hypothetical protein
MAHFAEIDEDGIVLRVIVVDNVDISDANGVEVEGVGAELCKKRHGGKWMQTSYNGNFRFRYAGRGYFYDKHRDAFIAPKPFPSWELDELSVDWQAPVPYPAAEDGEVYRWDEETTSWVEAQGWQTYPDEIAAMLEMRREDDEEAARLEREEND